MEKSLSQKIQIFVELLHKSALSNEIKTIIINNAGKLTEEQIDGVIDSLKKEETALEELMKLMQGYETLRSKRVKHIQEQTRPIVLRTIDEFMESAEQEVKDNEKD